MSVQTSFLNLSVYVYSNQEIGTVDYIQLKLAMSHLAHRSELLMSNWQRKNRF